MKTSGHKVYNSRVAQSVHVYEPTKNDTGLMIHLKANSIVRAPAAPAE
jgi:hypothetical protein